MGKGVRTFFVASGFLRHARGSYDKLATFVESQIEGLKLAKAFLRVH